MMAKMKNKSDYQSSGPTLKQRNEKELIKSSPQVDDEQSSFGRMPNPEEVQEKDTLEQAQDMGLYTKSDDEHPAKLNIAKQINDAEKYRTTH
jgi:hypothetical protein